MEQQVGIGQKLGPVGAHPVGSLIAHSSRNTPAFSKLTEVRARNKMTLVTDFGNPSNGSFGGNSLL
jgi:hypothetical protein